MEERVAGLPRSESVTVDYHPGRLLEDPEWERRASFLSAVLGQERIGTVIDLGSGVGQVSAWAAARAAQVVAFDLSHTHCLLYTFFMWHRGIANAHVFHGSLDGIGGEYVPDPAELIVSFNALSRTAVSDQWPHINRYLLRGGRALLVYPRLYGGADPSSPESLALAAELAAGAGKWQPPLPPKLELVAAGDAGTTLVSLPCAARLTGREDLFDFSTGSASPRWTGTMRFPVQLDYRLYRAGGET